MFGSIKRHARLGQWDGRTRSSRSDEPVLPRLWQRPVMVRLALVLITSCIVTLLVWASGEPFPYRTGEIHPSDLRVRVYFETINQPQTELRREEAIKSSPHQERRDPTAREEIRRAVPPVVEKYPPGMPLVYRGQAITDKQLPLLKEEHKAYRRSLTTGAQLRRGLALFCVISLLAAVVVLYVSRFQPALAQSLPKIGAICALVITTILLGLLLSKAPWYAVLIPLTTTAMILTIVYNPQFALLMSFSLSLATTVALGTGLPHLLIQMGGLATAVLNLGTVRTRTKLVTVAAGAGAGFFAMTFATGLLSGQTLSMMFMDAGRNFLWGTLAGFLLTGALPLVERIFGIVTDIRLLELADGSHPLLQELVRRAPGTYTHSMTVATLAEPAAEAISANPLLARVGSYFHDIGKMLKPGYFVENQTGENRHDTLEPALSTLVIIGHVKDGVALAQQYRLPRPVVDCIQQHHGTTLVEYFYHEAIRLQEEAGHGSCELESTFRYPGPKPQNRENGIVMLADAVESASRSLSEPTPGSIRKLVHDLLMKRLLDGQFEDCGLTLSELHRIEESLCKGLIAVYHSRIRYPEPVKSRAS